MAGARSKFDTLIQSLPTVFPDNNTGQITPELLRDFLDSFLRTCFIPDSFLGQTVSGFVVNLPAAAAWLIIPVGVWGASGQDASGDLSASIATGRITSITPVNGCDYSMILEVSCEGAVNTQVDFGFFKSGVPPIQPNGTITLTGAGKNVAFSGGSLYSAQPSGTFWELGMRAPGGAVAVTVDFARINGQLKNTWA